MKAITFQGVVAQLSLDLPEEAAESSNLVKISVSIPQGSVAPGRYGWLSFLIHKDDVPELGSDLYVTIEEQ